MTNITEYLPKKEKMSTLQAKIPKSLLSEVKHEMKSDNAETWGEFVTALFRGYLAEKRKVRMETNVTSTLPNAKAR